MNNDNVYKYIYIFERAGRRKERVEHEQAPVSVEWWIIPNIDKYVDKSSIFNIFIFIFPIRQADKRIDVFIIVIIGRSHTIVVRLCALCIRASQSST